MMETKPQSGFIWKPYKHKIGETEMTQKAIDTAFLREYVAFSANSPLIIADCLYDALIEAHRKKDFATVGHLQVRLHAEMVACLETAGALLYSYSQWEQKGVMRSLLTYPPGQVKKFIEQLARTDDVLMLLRFPNKQSLSAHIEDPQSIEKLYNSTQLKNEVMDTCDMYLSEDIRGAYNKVKHAGLCIRNRELLNSEPGKIVIGDDVHVFLYRKDTESVDFASFKVTGPEALRLADKYVQNIREITRRSRALANFVAFCLEHDLMLRSG
jgi:hypothetical protein